MKKTVIFSLRKFKTIIVHLLTGAQVIAELERKTDMREDNGT